MRITADPSAGAADGVIAATGAEALLLSP